MTNARRPTGAAGPRWRKWEAPLPPLDPDPLHVEGLYRAGREDGYEQGVADSLPPVAGAILCAVVAGVVGFVVGLATGWAWG